MPMENFSFCLDSDDGLMPNSMDLVIQEWNKVENKSGLWSCRALFKNGGWKDTWNRNS